MSKCPQCGNNMVACPIEFSKHVAGYVKPGEEICQLHGTIAQINKHRA